MPNSRTDLALSLGAEGFLAAVLEAAAQPIWVVDPDGVIRFANPAAVAALGYDSAGDLLGRRSHETIHSRHPDGTPYPARECPMLLARATGETVARDLDWFVRGDGSMFPVSSVSVPIAMPQGRGAVVTFNDAEHRVPGKQGWRWHEAILGAQRRVATLVAGGAASADVFAAIAREVGHVVGLKVVVVWRYEPDGTTATVIGAWGEHPHSFPAGTRLPLDETRVIAQVLKTGRPVRVEDFAELGATVADVARKTGIRSGAGAPIIVDGNVWGAMSVGSTDRGPLPDQIEGRLAEFTELVATEISNAASRADLARLADDQAALRRVATLIAGAAPYQELFNAVSEEVGTLFGADLSGMSRYEDDDTMTILPPWSAAAGFLESPGRVSLEGATLPRILRETGRPAREDAWDEVAGEVAELTRDELSIRSAVGSPITVEGRVWGALFVSSTQIAHLPGDTESRLENFTELVGTAIANAQARADVQRLVEEQAALRRVATLVAQDVPSAELFRAVARQVGALLGADFSGMIRYEQDATVSTVAIWAAVGEHPPIPDRWSTEPGDPATMIAETRRPARVEDWAAVPGPFAAVLREELGVSSSVGCPIVVEGRLWGALIVHLKGRAPLPPDTEARTAQFTDLVATAIANAQARAEVTRLAQEQAALRRVATLVAREASQREVFTAIADEIGQLLGTEEIRMLRYEDERSAVVVASSGQVNLLPIGSRLRLEDESTTSRVFRTGQPARIDDYARVRGATAEKARSGGIRCVVATPIVVEGRLWGAMTAGATHDEPLPRETESRLSQFTDLMATAIANTESHARADRLAEEQAALRRVATLVAKESSPAEVFAWVAEETASVFGDVDCALVRDEGDGNGCAVGIWGGSASAVFPVGARLPIDGDSVLASVLRDGRPSRIDDYSGTTGTFSDRAREIGVRSAVGCPIVVGGRIWGAMAVASYAAEPFPPETESRIAQFSELVATAIANADTRTEVQRLAEEQAALRRVATLVADGASPTAVFDAVAAEMERMLDTDQIAVARYETGDEFTVLAVRGLAARLAPPGARVSHDGESLTALVRRTERPARMESYEGAHGAIADIAQSFGLYTSVGAPIVVDGGVWGVIEGSWSGAESPAPDTEERMARFAELLETAIANADSRDQLTASRARLLTAADEARRRVVRDLHDGAQQRLVQTIMTLKVAQGALREGDGKAESFIADALEQAEQGNTELRELAHGILPAVLTHGGLRAGIRSVVRRLDVPVLVHVPAERLPAEIEASAYFIVAEALTNVVKHAQAERAEVRAAVQDGMLHVEVRDDGIGGADPDGHGLVGMGDRVTALGGRLKIESPAGGGTLVAADISLSG
jgi:PAS domain S-box-containing protein